MLVQEHALMELFDLETFVTVVRERSFSRAATKLHRTQPAVSQAVRRLEEAIGEPLLDRSSREGILTDAGRVLHEYAEKLLNLRDEAKQSISDLKQMNQGRLILAANEFTSHYLLRALHEFRRVAPMIKITVQRSLGSRVPDEVLGHAVELGIISYMPVDPLLKTIAVYRDELAFVVYPTHPLAKAGSVSLRQLGAESFVAHNVPSPFRAKVVQAFAKHKTPLHMNVELPTIEAIKSFVQLGNGVALIPAIAVEAELTRGDLVSVDVRELRLERRLRLVYRKNAALSHAARAFLTVAETLAKERGERYLFAPEGH
jgi:DNA-binding transcriptional LysR family regulator